jgi:hypothetical protein
MVTPVDKRFERPLKLLASIGGYPGPAYTVELTADGLDYIYVPSISSIGPGSTVPRERLHPTEDQWAWFRRRLDEINVWCWLERYENPGICDGTGWSFSIEYPDRKIESSGDNNYPAEDGGPIYQADGRAGREELKHFDRLLKAIRELTTRNFR